MILINKQRANWGTYDKRYNPSDITMKRKPKNLLYCEKYNKEPQKYKSIDQIKIDVVDDSKLAGGGFIDTLRLKLKNLPKYANKAVDLYSGDVGTALRNMVPNSDDNARPGFTGEKHAILKLENGKNGVANFMGPGTNVIERLKRGDVGRTKSDNVAKRHDIDYSLAHGEKTKDAQLKKIREADNRMIKSLQKIREDKSDAPRNIQMGMRLIQAKKFGEDIGVLNKSKFSGDIGILNNDDSILLENERKKSQQAGYGDNGKLLPGQKLKMSLLKKRLTGENKSNSDPSIDTRLGGSGIGSYPSASKGLSGQKKGHVLKGMPIEGKGISFVGRGGTVLAGSGPVLAGGGPVLAGGNFDIASKIKSDIIPEILKYVKTKIPNTEIGNIVNKYLGTIKDVASLKKGIFDMSKELVPLMIMYKLKQSKLDPVILQSLGVFTEALKGSGMKGKGMKGYGLFDNIKKLMNSVSDNVDEVLAKAIWNYVNDTFLNPKTKGAGMKGGGFWSDFADGFKTGFVRTLQILKYPITILAPELAPAVQIGETVGNLLPGKMVF